MRRLNDRYAPIVLKKSADDSVFVDRHLRMSGGLGLSRRFRRRHRDQLGEFPEVLGGGCQVELVSGAIRSP